MTAPTLESHGFTLDFSKPLVRPPHWSRTNQTILAWERQTNAKGFDKRFRVMHHMVRMYGPLLRYELNILSHYCDQITTKKIPELVASYVSLAKDADAIFVYTPQQFTDEFPPEDCGVTFHPRGGYCIIDEYGSRFGKWRTADEAFHAWKTKYQHVPGWDAIPDNHLLPA